MGTRSLTNIIQKYWDKDSKVRTNKIATMYRQFDGYPTGHGTELAEFLASGKLVNGIGLSEDNLKLFNGIGCLAAQIVSHFKGDCPGNIYLYKPGTTNVWEDYAYDVIVDEGTNFNYNERSLILKCKSTGSKRNKVLFEGTPKEFLEWVKKPETVESH
jgi:hypothetical protein